MISVLNRVRTPGLVACSAAEGELGTYAVEIVPRALAIEVSGAVGLDVGDVAERLELANGGEHVLWNKTKSEIELFFPGTNRRPKKNKSLRIPSPPWVGSRSPDGWDQIPRWAGGWVLHQPPWSFGFDSQKSGTRENRRTLC